MSNHYLPLYYDYDGFGVDGCDGTHPLFWLGFERILSDDGTGLDFHVFSISNCCFFLMVKKGDWISGRGGSGGKGFSLLEVCSIL